jgi:hypothetical protein
MSEITVICQKHGHVGTYRSLSDRKWLSAKQAAKGHVSKENCTTDDVEIEETPFTFP